MATVAAWNRHDVEFLGAVHADRYGDENVDGAGRFQ